MSRTKGAKNKRQRKIIDGLLRTHVDFKDIKGMNLFPTNDFKIDNENIELYVTTKNKKGIELFKKIIDVLSQ